MSNEELATYLQEHPTDKARQEVLYFQVVNYVKKYINRFFPAADKEDLLQESYFALMKTVKMYNPDKGSFLNYFTWYLRNYLSRYIYASNGGMCAMLNELTDKYERTVRDIENLGQIPTYETIAERMGVDIKRVKELEKYAERRDYSSTDVSIGEDKSISLIEQLQDYNTDVEGEALDNVEREELKRDIWECVERLPQNHAEVLIRHFKNQEQYKDIAEDLEISYQQVTQRKIEAFRKMREDARTIRQLRPYLDNVRGEAFKGNGVGTFNRTWTSSTERIALKRLERERLLAEISQL